MLTPETKSILKEIISKDCQIRYKYFCGGKTCAIGAIAQYCGYYLDDINDEENNLPIQRNNSMGTAILDKFKDLNINNLKDIQSFNDDHDTPEERRARILKYLENI